MTRTERKHKLANAIKVYRGSREGLDGPWIRPAKPSAIELVRGSLHRLKTELTPELQKRIDGFKSKDEMVAFLEEL